MSGTVKVTINGRPIDAPTGMLVTEAAGLAEIHIPIFCSQDRLPPLGACRICVVEMGTEKRGKDGTVERDAQGQPVIQWMPKPQTACTTRVSDGLHVRTESPAAVKARKGVMEFLLVNHPLDCPVCDEGGECQLQDLAFAYGADFSRMSDAKRTFDSESLGPVVKKEANRCIVCMRCVRYCDEIMGDDALTAHQRGVWTEISSFNRQPLECEQCGNCIEVCPVGALTAVPYRFKARPWDLRQHIAVCPHCSAGCSVRLGVRGSQLLRARGTENRGVNREYLCVRGRFGHEFVNAEERLTTPLVQMGGGLQPSTWEEATTLAASRLREVAAAHGPGAIAFLGGEKLLLEEQYLMQKLARGVLGTSHIDSRTRLTSALAGDAILKATGGARPSITFEELVHCQEVLVLGDDLQGENPFAQAMLVRGQHQTGLHIIQVHPRRVKLARAKFQGLWLHVRPGAELALVNGLVHQLLAAELPASLPGEAAQSLAGLRTALAEWTPERVAREAGVERADLEDAARRLRSAGRKAILFGRAMVEHPQAPALLAAVEALGWLSGAIESGRSAVLYLGPQNNSQGAMDAGLLPDLLPGYAPVGDAATRATLEKQWGRALPATAGLTAPEILRAAAEGRIKALWIVSDNWIRSAPDRGLAEKALAACELVLVNELFMTETARRATIVFPVVSFAEKEGVVVNAERRLQQSARAINPRRGARTDADVFQAVARELGVTWSYRGLEDVFRELVRLDPAYRGIVHAMLLPDGVRWPVANGTPPAASALHAATGAGAAPTDGGLWVLSGAVLFQHGTVGQRSALLAQLAGRAAASLHPGEAEALGLKAGDTVELSTESGRIELPVALDDGVPRGAVFVPYAYAGVELNRLGLPQGAGLRARARRAAGVAAGTTTTS